MFQSQDAVTFPLFPSAISNSSSLLKFLEKSSFHSFREHIFLNINEDKFQVLFSSKHSRPNTSIRQLVGAFILKELHHSTYDKLFVDLALNMGYWYALNYNVSEGTKCTLPFCRATLFNFIQKVYDYAAKTGINLFEDVFNSLTRRQLKLFGIKTNKIRIDTFQLQTNAKMPNRLELLIELLLDVRDV
ncbi:MAG: hypothetical protein IAE91_00960, partial [Ignavibacteriaceae bacterium]|nr:hypothetical protein [Ignavibacteriaceae bacterium]